MKKFIFSPLLLAPLFALLAACGGGGGGGSSTPATPNVATLKSIVVTSAGSTTIAANSPQQLAATGTYSDGSTKNVTVASESTLAWTTKSGGTAVVAVNAAGVVTARGVGTETVTATVGTVSGSINLTVNAPWTAVAAGGYQTVGMKSDNKLYSWGSNIRGQLGDNTSSNRNAPGAVAGNSTLWKQVAVGEQFVVAIRTDGTLWAWGYNQNGQLGDGTQTDRLVPTQIGTAKDWNSIAAGRAHVVALRGPATASLLYTWGLNANHQLGDPNSTGNKLSPTQVGKAFWQSVAAGDTHSLAIQKDGSLWAWGGNAYGQVGNGGSVTDVPEPAQIGTLTYSSVAAGTNHSLAIRGGGLLYAWGKNTSGQLGNNGSTQQLAPVQVGTEINWTSVAGGAEHTLGVRNDGTLWAWGSNESSQLGDGSGLDSPSPIQIGSLKTWKTVSAGIAHSVALKADQTLWVWGRNTEGQLGNGKNADAAVPVNVPYE